MGGLWAHNASASVGTEELLSVQHAHIDIIGGSLRALLKTSIILVVRMIEHQVCKLNLYLW